MITLDYSPIVTTFLESKGIEFYEDGFIFVDDTDTETEKLITDYLDENNIEYVVD